jgi:nucleoside-diphosphate-sugar epimerase
MKLLIIGGSGFLSSAFVERGLAYGHEVTILTRGHRSVPFPQPVRQLVADRNDREAFRAVLAGQTFDAVIDAICYTPEDAQEDVETFSGRVGRFIMISTDFVYAVDARSLPATEDTPRAAPSMYGRNKIAAEDVFFAASDRLPSTILRPPHVVGAGGLLGTGSLQGRDPALLTRLRRGEPIVLIEGGTYLIQPVDRLDVADACLAVLGKPVTVGRAYTIAGPEVVTTREYYQMIADEIGVPLKVLSLARDAYLAVYPDRASFTLHRVYDMSALGRDAAFRPAIPLRQSLRGMIAWLEANPPPGADSPPTEKERQLLSLLGERDAAICEILKNA